MKLNCYRLKIDGCNYKIFYANIRITTKNKKSILDTYKIKRIKAKHYEKSTSKGRQQRRKRGAKLQSR